MAKLTKAPEIKINWGMQDPENQKEWKNWVFENLCTINMIEDLSPTELENLASELFDEIHQCGYEEGYDSAKCDSEGKEVRRIGGTSGVRLDKAFLTAKEANDAQKAEVEEHKEELRSEITDVESLLKFPLDHCLNGDEYTDWQARAVYEEYIEKYKKGELK